MDLTNKFRMGVNCTCSIPECTFCEKNDPTGERRSWRANHYNPDDSRKTYDELFLSSEETIDGLLKGRKL